MSERRIAHLLLAVLGTTMAVACDNRPGPSARHPALSHVVTTEHYVFQMAPGDRVDTAWQERYYAWVIGALELQPTGRLEYLKYRDRAHLEALTGRKMNGFAERGIGRFHTIWPRDNHEVVHSLMLLYIGRPPPLSARASRWRTRRIPIEVSSCSRGRAAPTCTRRPAATTSPAAFPASRIS